MQYVYGTLFVFFSSILFLIVKVWENKSYLGTQIPTLEIVK